MADDQQADNSNETRLRYNFRARKPANVTTVLQQQHPAKPSNARKRKAAQISNDNNAPSQASRKLTFFDLPAEIRNDIYVRVLRAPFKKRRPKLKRLGKLNPAAPKYFNKDDKLALRRFERHRNEVKAAIEPIGNMGDHKHHGSGYYAPYSIFGFRNPMRSFYPDTLFHKDPALWQVSRRMREEARSLYIAKYCSVDVRGLHRPFLFCSQKQLNEGLAHFESWLANDLNEQDRQSIVQLEVWDEIRITIPAGLSAHWDEVDDNYHFIPAFHLRIFDNGKMFKITTPFELIATQAAALQAYFDQLAQRKISNDDRSIFDGLDIAACVRSLRTSAFPSVYGESAQIARSAYPDLPKSTLVYDWCSCRFSMTVKDSDEVLRLSMLRKMEKIYDRPFEYVAASVQLPAASSTQA